MEHFVKVARAVEQRIGTIVSGSPQETKTMCRQRPLSLPSDVCVVNHSSFFRLEVPHNQYCYNSSLKNCFVLKIATFKANDVS